MSLITFGTDLVDVCDVDIVATTGSTCMVYFQDGSYVASSLTAAAQAAAVNGTAEGALLTTVVTSTNFGTCYIAGQHVKRVRAAGADSIWDMCSGLGPVYVSGVDVTAAGVLIDATGECGGGGGGGIPSGDWIPSLTPAAGTEAEIADGGRGSFIATGDDVGSVVICSVVLEVTTDALSVMNVTVGLDGLPIPADGLTVVPLAQIFVQSGDAGYEVTLQPLTGTSLVLSSNDATTLATTVLALITVTYQVDAS